MQPRRTSSAQGGVLITADDTSDFAVTYGLTPGVSVAAPPAAERRRAPSMRSKIVDGASPIAYGYGENLSVYSATGLVLRRQQHARRRAAAGGSARDGGEPADGPRHGGRSRSAAGPAGRRAAAGGAEGRAVAGGAGDRRAAAQPLNVIPPAAAAARRPALRRRPRPARSRACSRAAARSRSAPAVVDVPLDKGHVVLFSNNPMWRGETQGSYFLVFNAILNFDNLDAGRKLDEVDRRLDRRPAASSMTGSSRGAQPFSRACSTHWQCAL